MMPQQAKQPRQITKVNKKLKMALLDANPGKVEELNKAFASLNDGRVTRLQNRLDTGPSGFSLFHCLNEALRDKSWRLKIEFRKISWKQSVT